MFDLFSWSHIIILLAAALIIVGPKDLPRLMHMAGKWAGKARAMANEFRRSFDEMARQAELDELRKEIEDLKKNNPVAEVRDELNRAVEGVNLETGPSLTESPSSTESAADTEAAPPPENPQPDIGPEPRSGEFAITDRKMSAPAEPVPAGIEPPPP
jgi:sec-independent protein translocase protein TatB